MKTIDSHTHVHAFYDKNGKSCIEWAREYAEQHCDAVNVCAISHGASSGGKYSAVENIRAALMKLHVKGLFAYGGIVHPSPWPTSGDFDALTQYRELMEIGFDGLKSLENKPSSIPVVGMPICDPFYDPFYAEAEREGTHMIWHVADPPVYWKPEYLSYGNPAWYCGGGRCIPFEEILARVFNVLDRYPRLHITFAHFFFLSDQMEVLERLFEKYPNISLDITPGTEMYTAFDGDRARARDFLVRHADRIFFGTDCGFGGDLEQYNDILFRAVRDFVLTDEVVDNIWGVKVRGLALSEEAASKILSGNFARYHETPKPISTTALAEYAEKYLPTVESAEQRKEASAFLERYL